MNESISVEIGHDKLMAFYKSASPFISRLRNPRFDTFETNDYVCGSTDCQKAISALDEIEASIYTKEQA